MNDLISLWIEDDKENEKEFRRQELIIEVAEAITKKMEEKKIKRSAFAKALGKTTSFVTQLLTGSRNMTLSTVSDLAFALDAKIKINITEKDDVGYWSYENREFLLSSVKVRQSTYEACNNENYNESVIRISTHKAAA